MNARCKAGVVLCIWLLSDHAYARACDGNMIEIQACEEQRYTQADQQLNAVYKSGITQLDGTGQAQLRDAQRAWLKYFETSIKFAITQNKNSGSYGAVVVSNYKAKLVERRVKELQNILSSPADPPVEW